MRVLLDVCCAYVRYACAYVRYCRGSRLSHNHTPTYCPMVNHLEPM